MRMARLAKFAGLLIALGGCSSSGESAFEAKDRLPGERAPLSAACDEMDPMRCLLPWPSNTYAVTDSNSATGLRIAISPSSLTMPGDETERANLADGFSRVTPLVTAFAATIEPSEIPFGNAGPVRLLSSKGEEVPLRIRVERGFDEESPESFVFAYPLRPLEANADYVAVVLDELATSGGEKLVRSRAADVALGLAEPASDAEAKLRGYHAPTRGLLKEAGIDAARVLRVWDFTTRSEADPTSRLLAMRESAVDVAKAKTISAVVDKVDWPASGTIAAIVEGHLTGLPSYLDENKALTVDANGMPVAVGTREAPFRIVIPRGEGDYRFVMYGHGTGGTVHDDTFDSELAELGIAKVGVEFHGWTETEVIPTFAGLNQLLAGSNQAVAQLMQAIADGAAIQTALGGVLGDALSADTLDGTSNPAAGRRPSSDVPMWVGGSLGGTMSLVATAVAEEARYAVLNVPGAAWTHFIPGSKIFDPIRSLLRMSYGSDGDILHALAMSQGIWDEIDGASWQAALSAKKAIFLVQESMDDPVLPNPGSDMVAVVTDSLHIGKVLSPIAGLSEGSEAVGRSAVTQYRVRDTGPFEVHGFAGRDTPAGAAAREQIRAFLASIYEGAPKITVPAGCENASCDFSQL